MKTASKRQVFFNSDENYLVPLTVMTYSLLKSNDPTKGLDLYIATTGKFLSLGYDEKIRALFKSYPLCRVFFINAEEKLAKFSGVIASELNVWSPVMWSGSLITEVVPPDVTGNLVYLDVDMMVRHDLEELYSLDLEGGNYLLAAVSEAPHDFFPDLQKRGWGPECGDYFNYGCMVVNTDAWRRENIPEKMLAWYAQNPDTFLLNQDTSNVVCGARTLRLHPRYNYFDAWVQRSIRMNPFARTWRVYPKRCFLEAMLDPYVVHYVGREKPWNFTRRPERVKYHEAMRELGLYDPVKAEGANWVQRAKLGFFGAYHRLLYKYVRFLARHALPVVLLALAVFGGGCRLSRYDIDETMDGQTIEVKSGDRLSIVLEENATTGYIWMAACDDPDIRFERETLEPERDEHDIPICGAPTKVRFIVRVEAGFDGPSHVKFAYRRPWEKKPPVRQIDVVLYHTAEDKAPWK